MAEQGKRNQPAEGMHLSRHTLNISLVVLSLAVGILLYALANRTLSPRTDPNRDENPGQFVGAVLQVEVRNGCGVTGLAQTMTQFLRQRGFDVVEVGDLPAFDQDVSVVYDRIGDMDAARKLAVAIGIPEDRVIQDIKPEEYLDASVIIGKDYETLRPFQH